MAIGYTPRTWVNGSSPAVSAANLQAMDNGINAACDAIDAMAVDGTGIAEASTTVKGRVMLASTGIESATKAPKATGAELAALLTAGGFSLSPATGSDNLDNIADGTTYKRILAAVATALNGGTVAMSGKKYRVLAGCIRNTAGTWAFIDDSNHAPVGFNSVTTDSGTEIYVGWDFTASKIGSLVVVPDETFAGQGLFAGASVGMSSATIHIYKQKVGVPITALTTSVKIYFTRSGSDGSIGGYAAWNGSSWNYYGDITNVSFADGVITITHGDATNKWGVSAFIRQDTTNLQQLVVTPNDIGTTTTKLQLNEAPIGVERVNPLSLTTAGSNLWLFGLMEVA